jgi:hypothetical protein
MMRRRPTLPRLVLALALIVAAVVAGTFEGDALGKHDVATVNGYPRVPAPGVGTISLDRPGTYLVFYESVPPDWTMSTPGFPVRLWLVDARGVAVAVSPVSGSRRTELGGGRAGVAVARFTIDRPGAYRVTVDTGGHVSRADVAIAPDSIGTPGLYALLYGTIASGVFSPYWPLLLLAILCLVVVGLGMAMRRGLLAGSGMWRRRLAAWSLAGPHVDEAAIARDVQRCWARLSGSILVGMGAGVGLATLLLAAVLEITARTVIDTPALLAFLYLGILAGGPIGYGLGAAEIRRSTAGVAAYADLRPRRAGDYVSPVVRGLGALPAAALCLLTVATVVHRPRPFDQLWQLALLVAGMVLTVVVAERLLAHVAAVPRLLVTAGADASRRADDMLRSHVVVSVEGLSLIATGGLGIQATARLGLVASGMVPDAVLVALLVGCFAVTALSPLVYASSGRLGGTITGWPWSGAVGSARRSGA